MGTFEMKNGPEFCHIVAKMAFFGVRAARLRADVLHCQAFLIFAHLRASGGRLKNNRFSVLKWRCLPLLRAGAGVHGLMGVGHEKAPHPWAGAGRMAAAGCGRFSC